MKTNYEKSNEIVVVRLNKFDKKYYTELLNCGEDIKQRQRVAQKLIDYLCDKFKIKNVQVIVIDKVQPHNIGYSGKMTKKTLGLYTHIGKKPMSIKIWNKTAIKQQTISIKVFAETLLHEFMHHYDTLVLDLDTIHSAGFYKRITDLENKLK
jgi:hypothetical protein